MDLITRLCNSAGYAKTLAHAELLAKLPIKYALLGVFTWKQRDGQSGDVYGQTDRGGRLNALGMPNVGLKHGKDQLRAMIDVLHKADKIVIVNTAAETPADFAAAVRVAYEAGADIVEVNIACPNTEASIIAYDIGLTRAVLGKVHTALPVDFPLMVKVAVYHPRELKLMAETLNFFARHVSWSQRDLCVVCSNTWPNAYAFKPGTLEPLLSNSGYGGLSGPGYKPIVLGQVKQFRELLDERVSIWAAGDIQNGQDVREYAHLGASGFQVGNAFMWEQDGRVFERIIADLVE